jgi:hypothetical protein
VQVLACNLLLSKKFLMNEFTRNHDISAGVARKCLRPTQPRI